MDVGPAEIGLILLAVMLLFGYKKLPDAARSFGRSLRIFKGEMNGLKDDDRAVPQAPLAAPDGPVEPVAGVLEAEARAAEAAARAARARAEQARTEQARTDGGRRGLPA